MTVFDKKKHVLQMVEDLSEVNIDNVLAYLTTLKTLEQEKEINSKFEELLIATNEQYKKVWEALA
jgi:hypothetical protein